MKRLHFAKPNNLSRLHNELLTAIPTLAQTRLNAEGRREALPENVLLEGMGNDIWLTVPDTADEAAIAAVVQAHSPLAPGPPTPEQQAWAAATQAQKLEMLGRRAGLIPQEELW